MLNKKRLKKYCSKRWRKMLSCLNTFCTAHDPEALHQLRLNGKKIKAISKLLEACSKNNKNFSTRQLKQLFNHAGTIRTAQLNLEKFTKYHLQNVDLKNEQNDMIHNGSQELCGNKKYYKHSIRKLKKSFSKKIYDVKDKRILAYYKNNLAALSINFLQPIDTGILHENRKTIKNLIYTLKALPHTLIGILNINEQYLDHLQEVIGQWHDTNITLDLMLTTGADDNSFIISLFRQKEELFKSITSLTELFDINIKGCKQQPITAL